MGASPVYHAAPVAAFPLELFAALKRTLREGLSVKSGKKADE